MLSLILLRMWRERRVMAILLWSVCLVAMFMALGPLYVQAIAGAEFDQRIANAPDTYLSVMISNEQELSASVPSLVEEEMGDFVGTIRPYRSDNGFIAGSAFLLNENNERETLFIPSWYRSYGYASIESYFNLVDGRYPEFLSASEESPAQVEAVITRKTADDMAIAIGTYINYGEFPDSRVTLHIVGIVEPILPETHPFWGAQTVLDIFLTPIGNEDVRPDISLIVIDQAYQQWVAPAVAGSTYLVQADIPRENLSSLRLADIENSIQGLNHELLLLHPNISTTIWLTGVIESYRRGIEASEGPISLLSFLVLVLMLYNIVTIANLVLEQQAEEWAMISSRGGSAVQLVGIQFATMLILGLLALVLSPFLAYGLLILLSYIGPQADILDASRLGGINTNALIMSSFAVVVSVIALTLPAYAAARKSLLRLKSGLSRPPQAPVWSRYFLDVILLALGIGFLLRLYNLNSEEGIISLLQDPSSLVRILASQNGAGNFSDIFNIAAPALILVGASLLWMRIFPYLMRLFALIFANGRGLTARLAFWNVERDPAHYAQLVLLLIGTLALGTASLALSQTRELGAWQLAHEQIGADAVLELDAEHYNFQRDWLVIPNVQAAIPYLFVPTGNDRDGALIGVDYDAINTESFPEYADLLAPLADQNVLDYGGINLPANSQSLLIDIYLEEFTDAPLEFELNIVLEDVRGTEISLSMRTDNQRQGEFQEYRAEILEGLALYRITAFTIYSVAEGLTEHEHRVYFDNLRVLTNDGATQTLESFEPETTPMWQWDSTSRFNQIVISTALANDNTLVTEGNSSLRLHYLMQIRATGGEARPSRMNYRPVVLPALPVVVNRSFAENEGGRLRLRDGLQVGDTFNSRITIPLDALASTYIIANLEIVGIVEDFPAFASNAPVVVAPLEDLRRQLNNFETFADDFGITLYYDVNRVWLDLENREPDTRLEVAISEIEELESVNFAFTRFTEIQREPLANSLTGMLFAGFWISLLLGLIDFAFYMSVTLRRRALSFATLQAIGWSERQILNLLLVEQLAFISPALLIGVFFGIVLSYLILPFMSLVGALSLQIPILSILILLIFLLLGFAIILRITALSIRRFSLNQVMRFGE